MRDINGEEFLKGDTLKVIKEWGVFEVGDLLVCLYDDDSDCCRFYKVGGDPTQDSRWCFNATLQKL